MERTREVESIHFQDGIYIIKSNPTVEYDPDIEGAELEAEDALERIINESVIVNNHRDQRTKYLYGGRVILMKFIKENYNYRGIVIKVDGIMIAQVNFTNYDINYTFNIESATAQLNAIAVHGVDAFIDHYKQTIVQYIEKTEELFQQEENLLNRDREQPEDEVKSNTVRKNKFIFLLKSLWSIMFLLDLHMKLGLENDTIVAVVKEVDKVFGLVG
jgi:hypothetical protein